MMGNDVRSVIKAWHMVESVEPGEVPKRDKKVSHKHFTDQKERNGVSQLNNFTYKPWEQDKLKNEKEKKLEYSFYLGCFRQYQLVEFMRGVFNNTDEIINRDYKILYSFTFKVDSGGNYITDSIFVPMLMYLMEVLSKNPNVSYNVLVEAFREKKELFEEKVQELFVNGVTNESIKKVYTSYNQYFYKVDNKDLAYIQTKVINKKTETANENMNSFYLADLERVMDKGENETLLDYIKGTSRHEKVDINENPNYIEQILEPKNLPNGRWPSPVEHRLSLMQQVAVNQILQQQKRISSVNGPPGTGKTTLLQDVFADLVVQRAKEMKKLKYPEQQVFQFKESIELGGYLFPIYLLDNDLSNFTMVVASSNNGAVENISKELPEKDKIIRETDKNNSLWEYEDAYAVEARNLSMYSNVAEELLENEDDAWGLFSAALGKSENISSFGWKILGKKEDMHSLIKQLETENKQVSQQDWKEAVKEFQQVNESVHLKKEQLQNFADLYKMAITERKVLNDIKEAVSETEEERLELEEEIEHLQEQKEDINNLIDDLPPQSFLKRLFRLRNKERDEMKGRRLRINSQLMDKKERHKQLSEGYKRIKKQEEKLQNIQREIQVQKEYYQSKGLVLPNDEYWSDNKSAYEYRQINTIWLTDELNYERGLLFLKAMKLHKLILIFNVKAIKGAVRLFVNQYHLNLNLDSHRLYLKNMWKIIHLITPVISTTFASFSSMYRGIDQDFIDYLFIDEAGQASPQQAVGAFWRSKRAIVVGDPLQIEPVVTVDNTVLEDIKKRYGVENRYISTNASVQSLADMANVHGTYIGDRQWIGSPLWVHRRCLNPMFKVSNEIAYENRMVLANKGSGESIWYDCKGLTTNRQYVQKQGELMAEHIVQLFRKENELPNVYIITPFTAVKNGIKREISKKLGGLVSKGNLKSWLKDSVGTVHTFQGKEQEIVYFVTGTDRDSDGAANWSCAKPNLLNVAVTRAKKEFHVIGDYNRFLNKRYYQSVIKYVDKVEKF